MINNVYTLNRSIPETTITKYNLCTHNENSQKCYGIEVTFCSEKLKEEKRIDNISPDKTFVLNLIKYLYENSVDTAHFRDIIEDYILNELC